MLISDDIIHDIQPDVPCAENLACSMYNNICIKYISKLFNRKYKVTKDFIHRLFYVLIDVFRIVNDLCFCVIDTISILKAFEN